MRLVLISTEIVIPYTLYFEWQKRQKSRGNQCSVESSEKDQMKLNDIETFDIEIWK